MQRKILQHVMQLTEKLNGALQAAAAEIQAAMQVIKVVIKVQTGGCWSRGGADDVTDVDFEEVK
jgi:hypothetical protein